MKINLIIPKEIEEWVKEAPDGTVLPLGDFYMLKIHNEFILRSGNWEEISKILIMSQIG